MCRFRREEAIVKHNVQAKKRLISIQEHEKTFVFGTAVCDRLQHVEADICPLHRGMKVLFVQDTPAAALEFASLVDQDNQ